MGCTAEWNIATMPIETYIWNLTSSTILDYIFTELAMHSGITLSFYKQHYFAAYCLEQPLGACRAATGQMGVLSRIVLLCPLPQILWK